MLEHASLRGKTGGGEFSVLSHQLSVIRLILCDSNRGVGRTPGNRKMSGRGGQESGMW